MPLQAGGACGVQDRAARADSIGGAARPVLDVRITVVPNDSTDSLVSSEELESALSEVEVDGAIPTLDEPNSNIVPVPVQAGGGGASSGRSFNPAGVAVASKAPDKASAGKPEATQEAVAPPSGGVWAVLYRAVDLVLLVINAPFKWLGGSTRNLVGMIAIVTIITSILAMNLLPYLTPNETPITRLHDKAIAAQAAQEQPEGAPGE